MQTQQRVLKKRKGRGYRSHFPSEFFPKPHSHFHFTVDDPQYYSNSNPLVPVKKSANPSIAEPWPKRPRSAKQELFKINSTPVIEVPS